MSALFRVLSDLNRFCLLNQSAGMIDTGEALAQEDGRLTIPAWHLRLMTDAVTSFHRELTSSPREIEIVTGSPLSRVQEVLSRLQASCRAA